MNRAKVCGEPDCDGQFYARDRCRSHYERARNGAIRKGKHTPGRPGTPPRLPTAFREHGMTVRQVEYLIERGHIAAPKDERGRRQWTQREVAVGVLAYRLVGKGLSMDLAAVLARRYVSGGNATQRFDLAPGIQLKLSVPGARKVGK